MQRGAPCRCVQQPRRTHHDKLFALQALRRVRCSGRCGTGRGIDRPCAQRRHLVHRHQLARRVRSAGTYLLPATAACLLPAASSVCTTGTGVCSTPIGVRATASLWLLLQRPRLAPRGVGAPTLLAAASPRVSRLGSRLGSRRALSPKRELTAARTPRRCPARRRYTSSPMRSDRRCAAVRRSPWSRETHRSSQSGGRARSRRHSD